MAFGIIIKKPQEKYAIIRNKSQAARAFVSRENRQEYDNEKRAKEISAKMPASSSAYNAVAVSKMMGIGEKQAEKLINKKSKGLVTDGKID